MRNQAFILSFLFLSIAAPAAFDELKLPKFSVPVVDEVGILSSAEKQQLTGLLVQLKQKGNVQMAIYIPKSLKGYAIEDFSMGVVEKWGLGNKKDERGLALIIAPNERKMRLEVGYGLEGDITDAFSKGTVSSMVPYFRKNRFGDGIAVAIAGVAKKLDIPLSGSMPTPIRARRSRGGSRAMIYLILIILWVIFGRRGRMGGGFLYGAALGSMLGAGLGGRGGYGGGGGGFGGFSGGGGFGGGGASGSW